MKDHIGSCEGPSVEAAQVYAQQTGSAVWVVVVLRPGFSDGAAPLCGTALDRCEHAHGPQRSLDDLFGPLRRIAMRVLRRVLYANPFVKAAPQARAWAIGTAAVRGDSVIEILPDHRSRGLRRGLHDRAARAGRAPARAGGGAVKRGGTRLFCGATTV